MTRSPRVLLVCGLILATVMASIRLFPSRPQGLGPDGHAKGAPVTTSEAPLATAVEAVPAPSSTAEAGIVALHEFDVDVPLIEIAFRNGAPDALRSFHVPLSPHRTVEVDVVRFDQLADEEGVFSGSIRGYADSQAVFSYVGLAYAGTVVLAAEQRAYYITATETGQMRITELDLMNAPGCAQPLIAQSDVP